VLLEPEPVDDEAAERSTTDQRRERGRSHDLDRGDPDPGDDHRQGHWQLHPSQQLELGHAHPAAGLDHVPVHLLHADVGAGQDRGDGQHQEGRKRGCEAHTKEREEDQQQRVRRQRPADVGDAHREECAATGVADGETDRKGDCRTDGNRQGGEPDVFERAIRDPGHATPVGGIREPGEDLADQFHLNEVASTASPACRS